MKKKFVIELGLHRLSIKFGRFKFGYHRIGEGAWSSGLGIACLVYVKRWKIVDGVRVK